MKNKTMIIVVMTMFVVAGIEAIAGTYSINVDSVKVDSLSTSAVKSPEQKIVDLIDEKYNAQKYSELVRALDTLRVRNGDVQKAIDCVVANTPTTTIRTTTTWATYTLPTAPIPTTTIKPSCEWDNELGECYGNCGKDSICADYGSKVCGCKAI